MPRLVSSSACVILPDSNFPDGHSSDNTAIYIYYAIFAFGSRLRETANVNRANDGYPASFVGAEARVAQHSSDSKSIGEKSLRRLSGNWQRRRAVADGNVVFRGIVRSYIGSRAGKNRLYLLHLPSHRSFCCLPNNTRDNNNEIRSK